MNIKMNMPTQNTNSIHVKILTIIGDIPFGRVATYGQIASKASIQDSRIVSYALSNLKYTNKESVPWHRVVNRFGKISPRGKNSMGLQMQLLQEEGVIFDSTESIDLEKFGWK